MGKATVNIHADLIDRSILGDQVAQYELYKLYMRAMFNTAARIVGNHEDAEDVLQEAFVSAFKHLKNYRADASFGAWLKRIVINKSLSFIKKNQREMELAEATDEVEYISEDTADYSLSVEKIKDAVCMLPAGFRSVLTLYLFEGYDHQEISQIMGISESTSKTQYKRAKDKLKTLLSREVNYG